MNNIKEVNCIIAKYTAGKATLEESNADLNRIGSGIRLNPGKNTLTADEIANTHVGKVPTKLADMVCWTQAPARWIRSRCSTASWWTTTWARCTRCASSAARCTTSRVIC